MIKCLQMIIFSIVLKKKKKKVWTYTYVYEIHTYI